MVPAAADAATPGVNVAGAPTADRVSAAIATGAKQVRLFLLWRDFEPTEADDFPKPKDHNLRNLVDTYTDAVATLNSAGVQPIFVVTEAPSWANGSADTHVPPSSPATYATFLAEVAAHFREAGLKVAAYEVWNEPDEDGFWHPAPDAAKYAALLKAAYAAVKSPAGDPGATVLTGPTTGNNYAWLEQLYGHGAKGSFDGVAVHTDTACLVDGPDRFYRDGDRLARYTFLGYREVRATMLANGDVKPIWMTELGWSSTNGGSTSCTRGMWAGQKPSGVSAAEQADFLRQAFGCLANDDYVVAGTWFTLFDTSGSTVAELDHYGLLGTTGALKPAYDVFRQIAAANGGAAAPCGDFDAPTVKIVSPTPGQQFVGKLDIKASAKDTGVGLARLTFFSGNDKIRNFTDDLANDRTVGLAPWQGSGELSLGKHTIAVHAVDKNGNVGRATVAVQKVKTLASTLTPKFKLGRVRCRSRKCRLTGSLSRVVAGRPSIGGKVAVEWQMRNTTKRWRKLVGGLKPAHKPFAFTARLRPGRWRVRVVYRGQAPWKRATSRYLYFRT